MSTSGRRKKTTTVEPPADREAGLDGTALEDEQELRQEIEQTRAQLGETVEQLAARTDVMGRARAKAAELTGQMKDGVAGVRTTAVAGATSMRSRLAGKTVVGRRTATTAGGRAKAQLQSRAALVREAAPQPLWRTVVKGASAAKRLRVPLAAAAAVLTAGYLVSRWWRKR